MDKIQRGEVLHPRGDLSSHVTQVAIAEERRETASSAGYTKYERKNTHPQEPQHLSPDSGGVAEQSELPLWFMAGQELVEVSVLHVLCDHTEGVAVDAHRQQSYDVGVLQARHDLYLFQKVIPGKIPQRKMEPSLHTEEKK